MLEKVKEITAEALGVETETLTAETSFKEDLGADSLDLFEMVMMFEEEFGQEIPSEDLEKLTTIGAVVEYLEGQQNENESDEPSGYPLSGHSGRYGMGGRLPSCRCCFRSGRSWDDRSRRRVR